MKKNLDVLKESVSGVEFDAVGKVVRVKGSLKAKDLQDEFIVKAMNSRPNSVIVINEASGFCSTSDLFAELGIKRL